MIETRTFTLKAQGDADKAIVFSLPRNATLIGVEKGNATKSGTVSAHTLDINAGTKALLAAICSGGGADAVHMWKTPHLGGSKEAVTIAKNTVHTIDINQTGGGTLTTTITLYLLWSEV